MPEHILEIAERLRAIREISDLSAEEVARRISIPVSEYESYESGVVDIPVSVLCAVAAGLGVSLTELLTGDKGKLSIYSLVKKDKGIRIERSKDYKYKALAYSYAKRKVEPLLVYVGPAEDDSGLTPNKHKGHEFHYCLEGRYGVIIGGHRLVVEEGDSLYFDSENPHAMWALDGKPAKLLVVVI